MLEKKGEPCNTEMSISKSGGGASGNLKRHLMRHHPKEFEFVRQKDDAWKLPPANEIAETLIEGNGDDYDYPSMVSHLESDAMASAVTLEPQYMEGR